MTRNAIGLWMLLATVAAAGLYAQPTPDLFWFRFSETSGTSSTNFGTDAGSMVGGFTVATAGVFTNGTTAATPNRIQPGAVGPGAINLAGQSVWLDVGLPGTVYNADDFTFECWVNLNSVSQEGNVLFSICDNSTLEFAVYLSSASNFLAIDRPGVGLTAGTTSLLDASWHHVAVVYDRSAQTITGYIDGVQDFQITGATLTFSAGTNTVFFNGRTTTAFGVYSGRADEVRLHMAALAAADLADTLAPSTPGGGGDGGGGDDEGCTTTGHRGLLVLLVPALALMAVRLRRSRT